MEVVIGDYLRDWEIEEKWNEVEKKMEAARLEGVKFVEEKRDPAGKFRSYVLVAEDVTAGRL